MTRTPLRPGQTLWPEAYRRVLEDHPSDLATLLALARLERSAGKSADAEHYLRRALYVNPENRSAHLMLSEVLEELGELEGATFHLWRSRQLEDERAPSLAAGEYRRLTLISEWLSFGEHK